MNRSVDGRRINNRTHLMAKITKKTEDSMNVLVKLCENNFFLFWQREPACNDFRSSNRVKKSDSLSTEA